jgi:coenzyme F420-reducing hydrogenase gamma subunit
MIEIATIAIMDCEAKRMTVIDFDPHDYEECLVTFLDILGFQTLLNTRTAPEIRDMLSAFRRGAAGDAESSRRMDEVRMNSEVHAEIGAGFCHNIDHLDGQCPSAQEPALVRGNLPVGVNDHDPFHTVFADETTVWVF